MMKCCFIRRTLSTTSSHSKLPTATSSKPITAKAMIMMVATGSAVASTYYYYSSKQSSLVPGKQSTSSASPSPSSLPSSRILDSLLMKNPSSTILRSSYAARLDLNQIPSNSPTEDYCSANQIPSLTSPQEKDFIIGVYDGHAGKECAEVVSKYLPSYIAASLSSIPLPHTPPAVSLALKQAFVKLDADLLKGAFHDDSGNCINPAVSGSCAGVVYITPTDIYTAMTGDCRVVLGHRDASGAVSPIPLSEDQSVKNAHEYERMLDLHPGELSTLFVRGRVLGGLMPTRAFGDARYKWPKDTIESVINLELGSRRRRVPPNYITPPYVTAEPEVVHRKLVIPKSERRIDGLETTVGDMFLVIGCDGIYDELENEQVVHLVTNYLKPPSLRVPDEWTYDERDNAASHLIRNSCAVAARGMTGGVDELMKIPAPQCRKYRDDMTAYVLFFGTGQETVGFLEDVDVSLGGEKEGILAALISKAKL